MPFAVKQKMGNGAIHVFMATSVRVEGKTSPRQHRKYLGVLEGGELLLGKSVRDLSSDEAKALAAKGIAWNGRRAMARKSLPEAPGTVPEHAFAAGKVLEYGRAVLLSELSSRLGLSKALELAFGHRDADLVLCRPYTRNARAMSCAGLANGSRTHGLPNRRLPPRRLPSPACAAV